MEGRTVSHFRVVQRLGGGGMGVVYKAIDTRLDRPVALKFLPPELVRDDEARARLITEAKVASALDQANICTVYDIDTTPDGQLFIAMRFYDGATLKKRIAAGPMDVAQAIDIAAQVARGLAAAHAAGIIHRDIKPANLMLTTDGVVKIVDFGIAKMADQTGATRTGVTLGTVTYMSPEQIAGEPIDARTDIWALGATLYEMLTGRPPFDGTSAVAVMNAIATKEPAPLGLIRDDLPEQLVRIVDSAMRKRRDERCSSALQLAKELDACGVALTGAKVVGRWSRRSRGAVLAASMVVVLAAAGGVAWWVSTSGRIRAVRERIQEVSHLVDQDNYSDAFRIAEEIERVVPDEPGLRELWPRFSRTIAVTSEPPGARVFTRSYAEKADRERDLGVTPLAAVRVPIGMRRWRFELAGMTPVERATPVNSNAPINVKLDPQREASEVYVPGGNFFSWLTGINPVATVRLGDFYIDKYEITNRQYKAFVQAGGYRKREYWDHPFIDNGATLSWEQAMARFVDATGRPGPATWALGDYPQGQDDYPVSGVSWFEAAAYAKAAGKSLPTVSHWIRAAGTDFVTSITPQSNIQGSGVAAVGSFSGMSPYGAYDMAGNVREWTWNAWGLSRYILGGAWTDPPYLFTYANLQSPFDRSAINGIRLARYPGDIPEDASRPVEALVRDYGKEKPAGDEAFEIYRRRFSYDPSPLNASVEPRPSDTSDARQEKVTIAVGYDRGTMPVHVYLPTTTAPPYQSVIYFPGSGAITTSQLGARDRRVEFVTRSGRAFIVPIYRGTYERRDGLSSTWPDISRRYSEYVVNWIQDLKRTIEYLDTRNDFDRSRMAFLGTSWGGRMGAIVLAVEPRFKAGILIAAGLASGKAQPEVDQINFVTRVRVPVLMLNGRFDAIEPIESAQRPLFELLGTPKEHKRWVVFDDDHALPGHVNETAREAMAWLDRYLGPIQ